MSKKKTAKKVVRSKIGARAPVATMQEVPVSEAAVVENDALAVALFRVGRRLYARVERMDESLRQANFLAANEGYRVRSVAYPEVGGDTLSLRGRDREEDNKTVSHSFDSPAQASVAMAAFTRALATVKIGKPAAPNTTKPEPTRDDKVTLAMKALLECGEGMAAHVCSNCVDEKVRDIQQKAEAVKAAFRG